MVEIEDDVLIYDIETKVFGKPNPDIDILKIFGCYSYKTKKSYLLTKKEDIQKIIDSHKFMVGFNSISYDNPIIERFGIDLKYKIMIDLKRIFEKRAGGMKVKKGMLKDLLIHYSLDFITKTVGVVDDKTSKKEIDYSVFKKDIWSKEEREEIAEYTKRDIEVTRKLYEWCEEYFWSFREFLEEEEIRRKKYLTSSLAGFAYNAICKAMKWDNQMSNTNENVELKGGYVSYPAGERFEGNIYCLDFNSLYPHIAIQCNLFGREKGISDEPRWTGGNMWKVEGAYNSKTMSPICKLFVKWYADRLEWKKILDKREYSIKIILNTGSYGILNTPYYPRVFDVIAGRDCPAIGRQFTIYSRKKFREAGYKLIYSDSVGKNSLIRTNKGNYTIEELFNIGTKINRIYENKKWKYISEKEYAIVNNIKTLTVDDNHNIIYDKIKKIIRHKTKKKIYKIHLNCYDHIIVTEDHSLIWFDDKGNLIEKKPNKIKNIIGLKEIPVEQNTLLKERINDNNPFFSKELLQFLGFWLGDGGLSKANSCDIGLSTGLDTKEFIKKIVNKLDLKFIIRDNGYDIDIRNRWLYKWMKSVGFCGTSKTKYIPKFIFQLSKKQIGHFLSGFCSADGTCDNQGGIFCGCTNEKLVLQLRELFYRIGIQTTMKRDFKPNTFKGKVAKIPTYNFWLKISSTDIFKDKVGFIFDRKQNKIPLNSNRLYFAPKNVRDKIRSKNNPEYKGELVQQTQTKNYIDLPIRRIKKIEEITYNDYVYDIETENTHRFYANDILVHNTDSDYILDPFNDKEKLLKVKDEIIKDIKDSVPFPQDTFDMGIDDEIKYMFFFKGGNKDKEDEEMDEDDFINKSKGLMKKNYIYVTKDNKVVIKNLGIRKKSNSPLSQKIFWEYLVPQIIEKGEVKFSKAYLKNLIMELLEKDLTLAALRKDVGEYKQYEAKSPNSLPAQIAKKYGSGIYMFVPNTANIGVGKGKRYCTIDEFKKYNLNISHIDLTNVWKELDYFIKPVVTKNIFEF